MSLFATEKLPQPVVMTGVVGKDLAGRTLTVRLSELASGYERLNWRTAHQALQREEESGWRTARPVWASAPGAFQVAPVVAAPDGTLLVHFPPGEQAFSQLVGRPGLFAWVRWTSRLVAS